MAATPDAPAGHGGWDVVLHEGKEGPRGLRPAGAHGTDRTSSAWPGSEHGEARQGRDGTRRRIVEVALELIADHGFAATSTREIAERLGFTKAALYYHFRTKDDLLAAIVGPALRDLSALVAGAEPRPEPAAWCRLVEGYAALVACHRDLIRVLIDDPSVRHAGVLVAALPHYRRLLQLLSGTTAPDVAQRTRARAALGAVNAALLRATEEDDPGVVRQTAVAAACGALGIGTERRT